VVDMDHISHQQSIFASAPSQKYHIAEALYRNEIITGMSLNDVTLVLSSLSAAATYFCEDNHGQPPSICDASCEICKIQIHPQHSGTVHKVIVLKPHLGEQRVVRIEN